MGKLHSLRKAILKNPTRWYRTAGGYGGSVRFAGAYLGVVYRSVNRSQPYPVRVAGKEWTPNYMANSYKKFVKKVLTSNGLVGYWEEKTKSIDNQYGGR